MIIRTKKSNKHSVPTDAVRDETTTDRQESFDSFITDSTISTSSDTTSFAAESANEQNEKQATTSEKLSPSEIPVRQYFRNRLLENIILKFRILLLLFKKQRNQQ